MVVLVSARAMMECSRRDMLAVKILDLGLEDCEGSGRSVWTACGVAAPQAGGGSSGVMNRSSLDLDPFKRTKSSFEKPVHFSNFFHLWSC
jgi:hypothetical protein